MALGITVRSSTGDSMEYITGDLDFKANETTNVTFPMLPCGASIYGILVGKQDAIRSTFLLHHAIMPTALTSLHPFDVPSPSLPNLSL